MRKNLGMTLLEVMVAALIVVTAGIAAASIYAGTARKVQSAIAEAEAATLAETLRKYADENLRAGGTVTDTTLLSQALSTSFDYFPGSLSPPQSALVWRLVILAHPNAATSGYEKLHVATLTVARDANGNNSFDGTDPEVSTFVFLLKDN